MCENESVINKLKLNHFLIDINKVAQIRRWQKLGGIRKIYCYKLSQNQKKGIFICLAYRDF